MPKLATGKRPLLGFIDKTCVGVAFELAVQELQDAGAASEDVITDLWVHFAQAFEEELESVPAGCAPVRITGLLGRSNLVDGVWQMEVLDCVVSSHAGSVACDSVRVVGLYAPKP